MGWGWEGEYLCRRREMRRGSVGLRRHEDWRNRYEWAKRQTVDLEDGKNVLKYK